MPVFGVHLRFPGWLIWAALIYATSGTLIAHWIGWRLIPLNSTSSATKATSASPSCARQTIPSRLR